MKKIQENYSFSPADPIQLVNGSYNISKVSDPIELKRMNNFIQSVIASGPFQSRVDTMNQLRLKLNLLGFDIDVPKTLKDGGSFNGTMPLKRFGGVTGIDDQAQKLDNPYGPGPKMNLEVSCQDEFVNARVTPAGGSVEETPAPQPMPQEAPAQEKVQESMTFRGALNTIRRK